MAWPGRPNLPADVVQVWTQFLQKLSGNAEWRKLLDTYNFIPELVLGEKFRSQILESRDQFGKVLPSLNFKP